jgi:N-acetylglutamate synthase-like GNAT family acetyltransferase
MSESASVGEGTLLPAHAAPGSGFSEKGFYLGEFRGRTLGILLPTPEASTAPSLLSLLAELQRNAIRVVLVAGTGASVEALGCRRLALEEERLEGRAWREIRVRGLVLIECETDPPAGMSSVAQRLGLFKVIRLADVPGLRDAEGHRRSFVDRSELPALLQRTDEPLAGLLREVERLLAAGIPSVNLCTVEGLHDELFTYSGSGTLFTRERYIEVRRFGVDDFDAADDLIARGAAEGYLAPRTPEAGDRLLAGGFGAFVEGRHLAGIGALRLAPGAEAGEVASLYTLTRFEGEGVGSHLVGYAIARARERGLRYVYACTTSTRVGAFFERLGFRAVEQGEVPEEKWSAYDPERRQRLSCYRRDI